jgi:hypothetical protein
MKMHSPRRGFRWLLALMAHLLCAGAACACSIPVFRYALERWEPASYELIVFHRGKLSAEQQSLLSIARKTGDEIKMNVAIQTVDLDGGPAAELLALWKGQKDQALPALALRNPRGSDVEGVIWSAPFNGTTIQQALHSPARSEIAKRLLKGESAVWVLLESGRKARDDDAAQTLTTRVAHLQKTLKLAEIEADDVAKYNIAANASDLKVAFSVVRVARTDPAEQVLVRMLLASEDDLDDAQEPMAFPMFGRGRSLFALVGKGINHETIDEACSFVIGPCSCVVKELNPGQDILISAAWGDVAAPEPRLDEQLKSAGLEPIKPGTSVPIAPGISAEPPTTLAMVQTPTTSARIRPAWGIAAVILAAVLGTFSLLAFMKRQ